MSEFNDLLTGLGLDLGGPKAEIPTGGDFSPRGFIGPVSAGMLWTFTTQDDHKQWNETVDKDEDKIFPVAREAMGNWGFRYYFGTWEAANHACEFIGNEQERDGKMVKYGPELVWRFEVKRDDIVNWTSDDARGKWREVLTNDVAVKTLRSRKYRHVYHFMALPAAVAAVGRLLGFTEAEYDLSEFSDQNTVYDDRFYELMCGNPDENKAAREDFAAFVESLMAADGTDEGTATRKAVESGAVKVPYREAYL
jgi:hypothetical protein